MSGPKLTAKAELEKLQHVSFNYFLNETNSVNGKQTKESNSIWLQQAPFLKVEK